MPCFDKKLAQHLHQKIMTFTQFKCLSDTEMEFVTWNKGVVIAQREEKKFRYVLFQVDGFYAEVQFNRIDKVIDKFCFFDSVKYLEPYLSSIDIDLCLK